LISADILESYQNNFTLRSNTELMIDFVRRMSGNRVKPILKFSSKRMQDDLYKYKAYLDMPLPVTNLGGEWEDVYILAQKASIFKHIEILLVGTPL
jgi:hypothetical protein